MKIKHLWLLIAVLIVLPCQSPSIATAKDETSDSAVDATARDEKPGAPRTGKGQQRQRSETRTNSIFANEELFLSEDPLKGSDLFREKHCLECHSIQGIGGKTGPDIGEIHLGTFSAITAALWNHLPRMNEAFRSKQIEWPEMSTEEVRQLVTFLYYLNFLDKASNPTVGEKLFHEKNCIRCHSVGGNGGDIGPELDPFQTQYPVPYITAALWNKGPKMMQKMLEEKIPRPQFRERDVIDILAFIRSSGLNEEVTRDYLPPGNPIAGKRLFENKRCPHCHSIRDAGGTIGPDLAKRELKGSLSYILSELWNHGSNMWPRMKEEGIKYPKFEPIEMSDLISYLYFINFQDVAGSVEKGSQVFAEKKCKTCHIAEKPGEETIGPDLSEAGLNSPFDILSAMWNHAPTIQEKMEEEKIRWPLLEKEEMRDLLAYILSLSEE